MNNASAINSDQNALTISRTFNTDPETLFAYLTEPAHLSNWFAPTEELETEVHNLDLSVGGDYKISMHDRANEKTFTVTGKYVEIERPNRLVFTWHWESEDTTEVSRVSYLIEPADSGCRLELSHDQFETRESAEKHNQGWEGCIGRLEKALA